MSLENGRESQTPDAGADATTQKAVLAQMAIGAISLALGLYAVWTIAPMLPIVGPIVSRVTAPTNLLEQVADIGKSKQLDVAKFTDAGGLDAFPSWHGLNVSNMQTGYTHDGILRQLVLLITGKSKWSPATGKWLIEDSLASPALARSTLTKVCGSDNWQVTETGGTTSKTVDGGKLICAYNKLNDQSNHLLVTIELSSTQPVTLAVPASVSVLAVPSAESKATAQQIALTKQYFEVLKAADATFASQGQAGLKKSSEECWNRPGSAASKADCVDHDIAARQVLMAGGQREPTGPFATPAIQEQMSTVSGPGASPAVLNEMYDSLNQVFANLLAHHKAGTVPADLALKESK